jgi:hypothetical protein
MYAARDSLKLLLNKARYHTERVSHDLAFMKRLTRELRRESTDRPITAYVVYASLGKGKGSQQEILNSVRVLSYSNTPSTGALKWVPFPHDGEQHYLKFPATRDTEDEEELISLFKNAVIDERWEHAEDDAKLEDFDKDLDVNSQYTNIFVQKVQYDKETLKPVSVSVTGYSPYADPDGASPAHESREVEEDLDL